MKEKIKGKDLKYETKKYIYDFQQYETIRSVGESIYTRKASIGEAEEGQSNLLKNVVEINDRSKPKLKEGMEKRDTYESANAV